MLGDGKDAHTADIFDIRHENLPGRRRLSPARWWRSPLGADLDSVLKSFEPWSRIVICQTEYVNASPIYAIYASIGFTEQSVLLFENGSWFLNQRTFQICNTQIRMLKFDKQIV